MDISHDIPCNDITMDVTNASVTHPHIITHFISHLPQYAVYITHNIPRNDIISMDVPNGSVTHPQIITHFDYTFP